MRACEQEVAHRLRAMQTRQAEKLVPLAVPATATPSVAGPRRLAFDACSRDPGALLPTLASNRRWMRDPGAAMPTLASNRRWVRDPSALLMKLARRRRIWWRCRNHRRCALLLKLESRRRMRWRCRSHRLLGQFGLAIGHGADLRGHLLAPMLPHPPAPMRPQAGATAAAASALSCRGRLSPNCELLGNCIGASLREPCERDTPRGRRPQSQAQAP